MFSLPISITIFAYFALSFYFYWQKRRNQHVVLEQFLTSLPLIIEGGILIQSLFTVNGLHLNLTTAATSLLWVMLFLYWLLRFFSLKFAFYHSPLLVANGMILLIWLFIPQQHAISQNYAAHSLFVSHLTIAFLAYSLLGLAALQAGLMLILENKIKNRQIKLLQNQPSLLELEEGLFRLLTVGFILLTFTLITGIIFTEALFEAAIRFNHKTIFTLLAWIVFAGLLWGRRQYGWRGRKATTWTLLGFVLLVLAYFGTKFVLEVILHRL